MVNLSTIVTLHEHFEVIFQWRLNRFIVGEFVYLNNVVSYCCRCSQWGQLSKG